MKKRGFTLIELLVVIAIIGLLIISSLRRAKEAALNVICRNNLRRCGLAGSFWPYLGERDKSHLCPIFDRFARQNHTCIPVEPVFGYSMNALLGGFELSGAVQYQHRLRVRISDIKSPSSIFFFGPWVNNARYNATLNDNALCGTPEHPSSIGVWNTNPSLLVPFGPLKYQDCLASFHRTSLEKRDEGLSNAVFVDGHVDLVSWKDTYRLSLWTRQMPPLSR